MIPLSAVPEGTVEREIYLPDLRQPLDIWFRVYAEQGLLAERTICWQPQKHWEVHLVHYSHHDMGYTDLPSKVVSQHAAHLEQVVAYCKETQAWSDDVKFRYLIEQAWFVFLSSKRARRKLWSALCTSPVRVSGINASTKVIFPWTA
jgi:hypothetical protein